MDAGNKKLYLTRKKALIESSLPLFLSYSDARRGRVSHGFIMCVKDFGCIVRFYNNVKGLVPLAELSSEPVLSPEEVFYVGQVTKSEKHTSLSPQPPSSCMNPTINIIAQNTQLQSHVFNTNCKGPTVLVMMFLMMI